MELDCSICSSTGKLGMPLDKLDDRVQFYPCSISTDRYTYFVPRNGLPNIYTLDNFRFISSIHSYKFDTVWLANHTMLVDKVRLLPPYVYVYVYVSV